MAIQEDPPPGVPEWVITYGDMMALILTFFIMIVSMSELKKNDKFQGVADAMEQQFGAIKPTNGAVVENQSRRVVLASVIASGRARRQAALAGGETMTSAITLPVTSASPAGIVVAMQPTSLTMTAEAQALLTSEAEIWQTTQPLLEVRGYATNVPTNSDQFRDAWDLAYERARVVARYLMEDLHLNAERIRVSSVGSPTHLTEKQSARVEIVVHYPQPAQVRVPAAASVARPSSLKWK